MSYKIVVSPTAQLDIERLRKSGEAQVLKKLSALYVELTEHPYTGTGQPEPLRHALSGSWSRRLNQKHRLVYSVNDETVVVELLSAFGHYGDK